MSDASCWAICNALRNSATSTVPLSLAGAEDFFLNKSPNTFLLVLEEEEEEEEEEELEGLEVVPLSSFGFFLNILLLVAKARSRCS